MRDAAPIGMAAGGGRPAPLRGQDRPSGGRPAAGIDPSPTSADPIRLGIEGDRPDDVVEVVGDDDRAVGEPGAADAAAAQHLLEVVLVGAVVGDGRGRVLELVAGQDADDAVATGR